jgi:hypothetical protein
VKKLDDLEDGSFDWESCRLAGPHEPLVGGRLFPRLRDPDYLRLWSVTLLLFTISGAAIALGWSEASWGERGFAIGTGSIAMVLIGALYYLRMDQLADILDAPKHPVS